VATASQAVTATNVVLAPNGTQVSELESFHWVHMQEVYDFVLRHGAQYTVHPSATHEPVGATTSFLPLIPAYGRRGRWYRKTHHGKDPSLHESIPPDSVVKTAVFSSSSQLNGAKIIIKKE
jgi:hypothetical protein